MVDISKIGAIEQSLYNNVDTKINQQSNEQDSSIFELNSVQTLEEELNAVKANNGLFADGWDDFKNFTGLGISSNDCDRAIEQYKEGKITFEEAEAKINEYKNKQDSSLNLFSNIATSTVAIIAGTATGGLAAIGIGALVGAATKAGVKTVDRATNKVDGDAIDGKQIAKDALSGAVTGGIGVATAGTAGSPFKNGFSVGGKTLIEGGTKACVAKCAVTGLETGAISGASNNLIECAFEEDKQFNFKDFATETATSAVTGATVGAIMGGVNGTLRTNNTNLFKEIDGDLTKTVAANAVCSAEYKLATKVVKDIAA